MERNIEWTTEDEKKFINGIGYPVGHRPTNIPLISPHKPSYSRQELLGKYLLIAEERERWGEIDQEVIVKYVRSLITQPFKAERR